MRGINMLDLWKYCTDAGACSLRLLAALGSLAQVHGQCRDQLRDGGAWSTFIRKGWAAV